MTFGVENCHTLECNDNNNEHRDAKKKWCHLHNLATLSMKPIRGKASNKAIVSGLGCGLGLGDRKAAARAPKATSCGLVGLGGKSVWVDNGDNSTNKAHKRPSAAGFKLALQLLVALALALVQARYHQAMPASSHSSTNSKLATGVQVQPDNQLQNEPSEARKMLLILKRNIKPVYENYVELAIKEAAHTSQPSNRLAGLFWSQNGTQNDAVLGEFARFNLRIDAFVQEAINVLELKDFCTYSVISRLGWLKELIQDSRLLSEAYDLVAIEYHSYCLMEMIAKMPPVPSLVREVVKAYIDGTENTVPDLNVVPDVGDGSVASSSGSTRVFGPFNVNQAINRNGPLKHVLGLTLAGANQDADAGVRQFNKLCREFLIEIENRWQSMEMMNIMVARDSNGIKQLNNYVVHRLSQTKFADICSRLGARQFAADR